MTVGKMGNEETTTGKSRKTWMSVVKVPFQQIRAKPQPSMCSCVRAPSQVWHHPLLPVVPHPYPPPKPQKNPGIKRTPGLLYVRGIIIRRNIIGAVYPGVVDMINVAWK